MGVWGWEHGGGEVGTGAMFFCPSTFKTNDFLCFDVIQFVTLAWKGGEGSDYLFCCLFTNNIFLWGRKPADRRWSDYLFCCVFTD